MPLRGMIFDIDGTLVDTNPAHVEAWHRAFQRLGYDVPVERIALEIGKGGDKLVPSVLGPEMEERQGEALRRAQKEEFLEIAAQEHFRLFPCVPELFDALQERRIRTALATSSDEKHLQATMNSAGTDLIRLADVLVTKDDADDEQTGTGPSHRGLGKARPLPGRMRHGGRHRLRCAGLPGRGRRIPRPVIRRHQLGSPARGWRVWCLAGHRSSIRRSGPGPRARLPCSGHQLVAFLSAPRSGPR